MRCKCRAYGTLLYARGNEAFRKYSYDGDLEAYRRADKRTIVEGLEHTVGPRCPPLIRVLAWLSNLV